MVVTKDNYKTLKNTVEGRPLHTLTLADTYPALCYLTHRRADEIAQGNAQGAVWTGMQVKIVQDRQRVLQASKGIFVLRG